MKFVHSRLYKKYYPIQGVQSFHDMDTKDFDVLLRWILTAERDVVLYNDVSMKQAVRQGIDRYRGIVITYTKPVQDLCSLLADGKFEQLDECDLEFINDVLYRHKYNSFVSLYIFPTRRHVQT